MQLTAKRGGADEEDKNVIEINKCDVKLQEIAESTETYFKGLD